MRFKFRLPLVLATMLVVAMALAACGDSTATSAPASTTAAATTVAATTATGATSATTAAATSAATTTRAAASTAASTGAATTASAASAGLPAIAGVTEVNLDPSIAAEFGKQLPQIKNFFFKVYVSDDSDEKVATSLDTALTGAGYKSSLPGQSQLTKQGDSYMGLYSKAGAPDLLVGVSAVPSDPSKFSSNVPGLSADATQKFINEVKGKKTLVFAIGANDLLQALFTMGQSTSGAVGSATAVATTATATK
jgi:hypothetical protein